MRTMNVKRAIILLLVIGLMVEVTGCARWPYEPGPEPETDYQLKITVGVAGVINADDGIYYIVIDADANPATGPGEDILTWEDSYYYIKLENDFFYFAKPEESFEYYTGEISDDSKSFQVPIVLSDLIEDPNSIDINVITTDSENNTYDHLNGYFTINTNLGSKPPIFDSSGDSGGGGPDFDIVKVIAEITTLY